MCYRPITLKIGSVVPCGRCPKCVARRVSAWSFRLMNEEKNSSSAQFITLTYETVHVPIISNGLLSLQKRDLQLFFKRLRKKNKEGIKYYAVGEYGGKTSRPHYHCILYNADIDTICGAWNLGHIYYGNVSGASIGYCLKYMCKNKKQMKTWLQGRNKEFALMSKGLGISYLSSQICEWHIDDLENRMYCNLEEGKKISMPRYYKERLYWDQERRVIAEAQGIIATDELLEKILKQTTKDVWNEQQAIDAAYDKMYLSSLKIKV